MSEHRKSNYQCGGGIRRRKRACFRLFRAWIKTGIKNVLMMKFEVRVEHLQILATPVDHSAVEIGANVTSRLNFLLHQPPGQPSTPAAKIKNGIVEFEWQ